MKRTNLFLFIVYLFISVSPLKSQEINTKNASQYFQIADSLTTAYRPDSATVIYGQLVSLYQKTGNNSSYLKAKNSLIKTLVNTFQFERAEQVAEEFIVELEENFPKEHIYLANGYKALGTVYESYSNEPVKALKSYKAAIRIIQNNPNTENMLADLFRDLAITNFRMQEVDSTIYYFKKAVEAKWSSAEPDTIGIALTYRQLSIVNNIIGQDLQSLNYAWRGLGILDSLNKKHSAVFADIYAVLGNVHRNMGLLDSSLYYLNAAQDINLKLYDAEDNRLAIGYQSIGQTAIVMNRLNLAESSLKKSLNIALKNPNEDLLLPAYIYNSLGKVFISKYGVIDRTLSLFNQALTILGDTNTIQAEILRSEILSAISSVYTQKALTNQQLHNDSLSSSQLRTAVNYSLQAIKHLKNVQDGPSQELAERHTTLGFAYTELQSFELGEKHFQNALKIQSRLNFTDNGLKALIHRGLSEIQLQMGNIDLFEKYIFESIRLHSFNGLKKNDQLTILYSKLTGVYLKLGQLEKARVSLNKLQRLNEFEDRTKLDSSSVSFFGNIVNTPIYLESLIYETQLLSAEAVSETNESKLQRALELYRVFTSSVTQFISSEGSQKDITAYLSQNNEGFIHYASLAYDLYKKEGKMEYLEEAFKAAQMNKAVLLQTVISKKSEAQFSDVPEAILEKEDQFNDSIADISSQLVFNISNQGDSLERLNIQSELFRIKASQSTFRKELSKDYKDYFSLKYETPETELTKIQASIDADQNIIEYVFAEEYLLAFVVTPDRLIAEKIQLPSDFRNTVTNFIKQLSTAEKEDFTSNASKLYQLLIKPIEKHLVGNRIVIIPDDLLWNINFDLLINNEKEVANSPHYLIKDYAFSYSYSSVLLSSNRPKGAAKPGIVAFAFGEKTDQLPSPKQTRRGLNELPGSVIEVSNLAENFEGQFFFAEESNESNFKQYGGEYSVIHLAVHGQIDELNSDNSKLYFKGSPSDSTEDNLLYPFELYNMNLKADLAVLSSCNSGSGFVSRGEGIISIGRGFQYAGVNSLLLSKWDVSDGVAPQIILDFYKNLDAGLPKDQALRLAKLSFLETADDLISHPYFWGSFFILGDSEPVQLTNNRNLTQIILIPFLIIAALTLILILRKRQRA